jgi:hypothetical protein
VIIALPLIKRRDEAGNRSLVVPGRGRRTIQPIASQIPISIEVIRDGPIVEATIERLRATYQVRGPDEVGQLEVLISAEGWEEARRRIAAVIAGVDLGWQAHLRFLR